MLGAIAGDVIGSVYEGWGSVPADFDPLFARESRFTDDSVLTVAVADALLNGGELVRLLKDYARTYPRAGYGGTFLRWMRSETLEPYGSWGNGSAMRASPAGFAAETLEEAVRLGRWSAEVTHNHPEGIKGAEATAAAIFLARTGEEKDAIRAYIEAAFEYDLSVSLAALRARREFDVSCQGTVPASLRAFFDSTDFEHAVRLAVSMGGDTDTQACITGGIAQAYYGGVPPKIREKTLARLTPSLRAVVEAFESRYPGQPAKHSS
ncbi:MAG: ADP-ribosylglycohydrolase family protein [Isosphaeraceae bacterium]